jgi:hypothetical protein
MIACIYPVDRGSKIATIEILEFTLIDQVFRLIFGNQK